MRLAPLKWPIALGLSLSLHAAAIAWIRDPADEVAVAGGGAVEIAVFGNAFEDALRAGDEAEILEPVEWPETAEQVQPSTTAQPVRPDDAERSEEVPAVLARAEPVETTPQTAAETPLEAADVVIAEAMVAKPVEAVTADPVAAAVAETTPEQAEPVSEIAPVSPKAADIKKAEPEQIRPEPVETVVAAVPEQKPEIKKPPKVQKQTKPKTSGARGQSNDNAKRGDASGQANANANASNNTASRPGGGAGNAAVSNYPGQVYSKLRRSLRYPAEAKRRRETGEVHVSFVVQANGSAGSIRVVRSSGSSILDQAAVSTVRRAAPFPGIPNEARRSTWTFTVPLAFRR